ncbi:small integral membrane protein 33 [Colius striatus]|uniref:small integral membrane protein 33 n=1 Tax=Colius striatus TaxID=57412 RepID=UPI002B1D01F5|nr:small integral membrane protein 33 [Colius striatus]
MNSSVPSGQLRQPEPQDVGSFTPVTMVRSVARRSDALPVISAIVVAFVLLAVVIVVLVHYGPQLRTVQLTLSHEPLPQDMDHGVHLTDWKQLGSQKQLGAAQPCRCSCRNHLPCGSAEPGLIEVTYL